MEWAVILNEFLNESNGFD